MQSIHTPTLIMKHIEDKGLKICPVICEMPEDDVLLKIQSDGKFNEVIVKQLISVIYSLQGTPLSGSHEVVGIKPILDKDYDLYLIMFRKDFIKSTQTVVLATKQLDKDIISKYNNHIITNQLFSLAHPVFKLDLRIMYNNTTVSFAYFGMQYLAACLQ